MHDEQWSSSRVIATALWTWTGAFALMVWAAVLLERDGLLHAAGFTACASSAVAATASIRCYTLKVCKLLRARLVLEDDPLPPLRSLH